MGHLRQPPLAEFPRARPHENQPEHGCIDPRCRHWLAGCSLTTRTCQWSMVDPCRECDKRLAEIERTGAERVAFAAGHKAWQGWLTPDHFVRRMPVWPLRHFEILCEPAQVKPSRPTPMP